jgi:hypothetical protein
MNEEYNLVITEVFFNGKKINKYFPAIKIKLMDYCNGMNVNIEEIEIDELNNPISLENTEKVSNEIRLDIKEIQAIIELLENYKNDFVCKEKINREIIKITPLKFNLNNTTINYSIIGSIELLTKIKVSADWQTIKLIQGDEIITFDRKYLLMILREVIKLIEQ